MISNIETIEETARTFRLGHEANASVQFRDCLDIIEQLLHHIDSRDVAAGLIPKLLNDQQTRNWIGLADTLEYELLPLVKKINS